ELEDPQRVRRRLVERLVAGDGRQRDERGLRRGEREQDRDGVVVAGIAVEDHIHEKTSSSVGIASCAPICAATQAPAVQAKRSALSRGTPRRSAIVRAAVKASPAPVASFASIIGAAERATSSPRSNRAAPFFP